jgi:hypothetical protein
MKQLLENYLPVDDSKRKWVAISVAVLAAVLLTLGMIYGIGDYGVALFIFIPLFLGACPVVLYGLKKGVSKAKAWQIAYSALGIFVAGLFLFAMEGLICLVMVAPIGIALTWIGSIIGYALVNKAPHQAPTTMLLLIGIIPIMAFVEKEGEPSLTSVVTSIEINAAPETVWKNVVEFPQLDEPTEFIFKTGIAYPINAKIEGAGVGAIRNCNFTTGSFVEPITVWNEPHLLRFDVLEQPAPMKEVSFWDIDAPHLHDYFVSRQGQFRLTQLPNGNTRLEGTTWYYHNIRPAFYWRLWSDHIIHKIHERVLKHIKKNAEKEKK